MTGETGSGPPETTTPRLLEWLSSAITLGILIAVLSGFTALSSFQGSAAGSDQKTAEAAGRQVLGNAGAAYLAANQEIIQDYTRFDSWYLHRDDPGLAAPYLGSFSPALVTALERSAGDPFDDGYYEEMYAYPNSLFDEADGLFGLARQHDERADRLQLVVTTSAVGLALVALASLLGLRNRLRLLFAGLALVALALSVTGYFTLPPVSG